MFRSLSMIGLFVLSFSAAACGGGGVPGGAPAHGLDSSRLISSLSSAEAERLCGDSIKRLGGDGHTVDCGNDHRFQAGKVGDCTSMIAALSGRQCALTVGDLDACSVAQSKDVCADHAECDAVIAKSLACR